MWYYNNNRCIYSYDDIVKNIDSNSNPLIPLNQEHLRLYGTLSLDPNVGEQQLNLSGTGSGALFTLIASQNYIGNTKMITDDGKLNLQGGFYEVSITPQSVHTTTVGKTIDVEIGSLTGVSRAHLFDGVRSSGLSAKMGVYLSNATLSGTDKQVNLICNGFSEAATINMTCVIEVRMVSGQRFLT